jgi:hypothetical protein
LLIRIDKDFLWGFTLISISKLANLLDFEEHLKTAKYPKHW